MACKWNWLQKFYIAVLGIIEAAAGIWLQKLVSGFVNSLRTSDLLYSETQFCLGLFNSFAICITYLGFLIGFGFLISSFIDKIHYQNQ